MRIGGRVLARCAGAALAAALLGLGCAPKQRVPLACVPRGVEIFVDEEVLAGYPIWVPLRSDEPHTIKLRGPGYEPVLLVLKPVESEQGSQLRVLDLGRDGAEYPADELCERVRFVPVHKELEVELEETP